MVTVNTAADATARGKPLSLPYAIALAALVVFVDAFWLNQGVLAGLMGVGLLVVIQPRTYLTHVAPVRRQRLRNLAIYGTAIMLVFGLNWANNRLAWHRAEGLIAAVKAYHATHQRYPRTLDDLVPAFVERIPLAKYTLGPTNTFRYIPFEPDPALMYVTLPPFGRPIYSFTRDRWNYLD
jgi:hypothetical protein